MQHFLLPVVTKQDGEEIYAVSILGESSLQMCNIWYPSPCEYLMMFFGFNSLPFFLKNLSSQLVYGKTTAPNF